MSYSGNPTQDEIQRMGSSQDDFLQHANRFSPNPSGLNSLFADQQFRQRFPQARIHKNDWVDLGDGSGLVDSVRSFNKDTNGGEAWQWLTEAEALKGSGGKSARRQGYPIGPVMPGQSSDLMTQIMASLQEAQPDPQSLLLQQLI